MGAGIDQVLLWVQTNVYGIAGGTVLVVTVAGVVMSFAKKAVFYADFNDLAITAGMFALPALVLVAGSLLAPFSILVYVRGARCSSACSSRWRSRTWRSNDGSWWKTPVLLVGKATLSFLFIAYLYQAFTGKTRSKRGQGWFVVAILTPLTLALVAEHRGLFAVTPTGRIRAATGKARK